MISPGPVLARFCLLGFSLLPSCATQLLNANTLDQASTIDEIAIKQIIFNLAKTHQDPEAIPSQVQITAGIIAGKNSLVPQVTSPLSPISIVLNSVAKQVAGATTTTTATNSSTAQWPNVGATISTTFEASQTWNVVPVQYPDQLRRLKLLYQYANGYKRVRDLRCEYQVPERLPDQNAKPEAGKENKKDGKPKPEKGKKRELEEVYVRNDCQIKALPGFPRVRWTKIGVNPDKAFLTQPGCVLCIVPGGVLNDKKDEKNGEYYISSYVKESRKFASEPNARHIWVDVNESLNPLEDGAPCSKFGEFQKRKKSPEELAIGGLGCVDWLVVASDLEGAPAGDFKRVGGHGATSVYVMRGEKPERRWSEFVLAIIEATLLNNQPSKVGPPAPIVVVAPN